jgi:hypothetical protein
LVEHLVYTERVGGSSPSPPTGRRPARVRGRLLSVPGLVAFLAALAFSLIEAPAQAQQSPMRFRVARMDSPSCGYKCPEVVVADGVIEQDTPLAFIEFARSAALSQNLHSVVFLNSPGGNVVASMELGAAFRSLHFAAVVAGFASNGAVSGPTAGECASACVYAFMGAVKRVAPSASRVALHRMSVVLPDMSMQGGAYRRFADPQMVALLARYASRMGVNPALVWTAESLPPDHIRTLSPQEIARWRLAASRL